MPSRRKKHRPRPRRYTEGEIRRIVRSELMHRIEEIAPLVLAEMIDSERKRPGKLVSLNPSKVAKR